MTHIEQLIQDMCPYGVEFKTLGEVCYTIKDGMHNLPTSTLTETDYPIISAQNIYENKIDYTAKRYVDRETYEQENKRTRVEAGDVLLTIVATIGRSAVVKESRPVLLQRSVCVLKPKDIIIPAFLKYYLDTKPVQAYMVANAHGAAQAGLYINQVEQIEIPLPPLEIQERIVAILDRFSALAAELQAELQMRRKQYEYYRTQLLTPHSDCNSADKTDDRNWEWKNLEDIAVVQYGYPFEAEKFTDDDSFIPLIRIRDVVPAQASTYYEGEYPNEYIVKKGDILVGMDGNFNLEKWNDRDGLLNQRVCKIYSKDNNIVLNDFLYHYLRPEFKSIENEIKGGTVKHLSAARIKKIVIPVPSIKEQKRIAEALNLFTKIIQDMEEGIPAEQAAQQKRYEYYRDLLLTFDRKAE